MSLNTCKTINAAKQARIANGESILASIDFSEVEAEELELV
jgi:hypothetical protein